MSSFKLLLLFAVYVFCEVFTVNAETCQNGKLYPAETNKGYYYCANGVKKYSECPGENSYFDVNFSACRYGKPSSPPSSLPEENAVVSGKCQRIGLIGDLTDCSRFFHCDAKGFDLKIGNCPDNHIFDLVKLYCVIGKC
ncbi:uncharacterized protein LOC117786699 [Drosophila innubila]|uniref:uncharacterized protein LOC117786699 n=1 Tax=Drosophila innubila TaxID=198719 RepID=UPI00148BD222|nr:uncharacterized protein LOC117786699 [Drosophila innubila]